MLARIFNLANMYDSTKVSSVTLLSMNQDISFSKDIKSVADAYEIV